jgi:uncharacterized membrane protein YdfJ with MMPL/SSD domain
MPFDSGHIRWLACHFVFLGTLAGLTARHKRITLAATVVVAGLATLFGAGVAGRLSPVGLEDPSSESSQANALVAHATGNEPLPGFIVLLTTGAKAKKSGTENKHTVSVMLEQLSVALRIHKIEKLIRTDREVGKMQSALDTGPNFVSRDGSLTYIIVQFRGRSERNHVEAARRLAGKLDHLPGVKLGGADLVTWQASNIISQDARHAELIAFPILLLLLLFFFRGVVAAMLPMILGASAIVMAQAGLRLAAEFFSISALVLIVVTALGIGLAIDYSLLIVSRFREELALTSNVHEALERTMSTAGRTVLFSALTVIAAFGSLFVLPQPFFYSMGLGGGLVTALVCVAALVVLPALLALLGPRINNLAPAWLQRSAHAAAQPALTSRWYRLAMGVMRRPFIVALCAATLLIALGAPAIGIKLTMPSMSTMPASTSVRQVSDTLSADFKLDPNRTSEVVTVGATSPQLTRYRRTLRELPGVGYVPPTQHLAHNTAAVYVTSAAGAMSDSAQQLVRGIRALPAPFETKVTGPTPTFLDLKASLDRHLAIGALLIALTTFLFIFLLTGSVVLPLKVLLMNMLTVVATVGVLVLIFQDGILQDLVGRSNENALEITQPVVLIAIIFGISTDYGVFLIDRIREIHEAGSSNEQAVARGLERTGRITTTAALLLCVAIGSLVTSRIVAAREISLGLVVAVLLDATVVRALLVPALMRILNERNWWSPAPLRHVHARIWGQLAPGVEHD